LRDILDTLWHDFVRPIVARFHPIMSSLTKRNLIVDITNKLSHLELTQAVVTEVIDQLMETVTDQLCSGEKVIIRNFGVFQAVEVKAKVGRNPRNPGKEIAIPA